jgi:Na+/proline symporter
MSAFFMPPKYYIPAFVWTVIIFIIIAMPGVYVPKPHGIWELLSYDKLIHLAMFAPLSYSILWGFRKNTKTNKQSYIVTVIFGIIYAFFTEALQLYVIEGRNGNIYDAIADSVGVALGLLIFHKINN